MPAHCAVHPTQTLVCALGQTCASHLTLTRMIRLRSMARCMLSANGGHSQSMQSGFPCQGWTARGSSRTRFTRRLDAYAPLNRKSCSAQCVRVATAAPAIARRIPRWLPAGSPSSIPSKTVARRQATRIVLTRTVASPKALPPKLTRDCWMQGGRAALTQARQQPPTGVICTQHHARSHVAAPSARGPPEAAAAAVEAGRRSPAAATRASTVGDVCREQVCKGVGLTT